MSNFILKYRVHGKEEKGFVIKGEFDTPKEALDLANKLNSEQNVFYYDYCQVKIPK